MDWRIILDGLRPYAPLPAFLIILVISNACVGFVVWFLALWTARIHFRRNLPEATRELLRDKEERIERLGVKEETLKQENTDYRTRFRMAAKALQLESQSRPVKRRRTG